jgi:phosphoribosylformylglycinamidine (FGAM) synthase-like enzyme
LFSESAGRFIVTVAPDNQAAFEALLAEHPVACVGQVTETPQLKITGLDGNVPGGIVR